MSNSLYRDKKRRLLFSKNELVRLELKTVIQDLTLAKDVRYKAQKQFTLLSRNSSPVRIKNRCILTGRGHSVSRLCSLSRLKFRELASQGLLMGITKSSW